MKRRVFILVLALVVALSLVAGVMRARATGAGPAVKPTFKVIVVFKHGAKAGEIAGKLADRGSKNVVRYHIIPAFSATVSQSTLDALRSDDNVQVFMDQRVPAPKVPKGVEGKSAPRRTATPAAGKADPGAPLESEALQLTHAQDAWSVKVNGRAVMGQGVRVGMLDTGTDPLQPDLAPAIEAYQDFTGTGLYDNDGHGTATSSTVAAQGLPVYNPITQTTMRISGMAPRARVLMAKVLDASGGWNSQIIRGLQWLVDAKVNIISCSLGGLDIPNNGTDPIDQAVQAAIGAGITFVNSAGNDGPGQGTVASSGDMPGVISVGASTGGRSFSQESYLVDGSAYKGDQVIEWTARGPNALGAFRPDIMGFGAFGWALAPADGDVYDEWNTTDFGGTSMACPVVAGDLALAQSAWMLANPRKALPAPAYWKKLLTSTATDLGYPALDQSSGLVNAKAAVMAVLKRGKSMLVSVDGQSASSSLSAIVAGGAKTSAKLVVRNNGSSKEKISLSSAIYSVVASQTITKSITLNGPDYVDQEDLTVPAGTDMAQVSLTWPSGPNVSIRTTVYDSDGNYLTYGPTGGGYGHLSMCQIALKGPKDQRPVVAAGKPWTIQIYPRASMPPTGPQQVNLRIEFLRRASWSRVKFSSANFHLKKGASRGVKTTLTAPSAAGTYTGAIRVSNGSKVATVPVSIRVPVKMKHGTGSFGGRLTGSTVEYYGGEFYYYDFTVPGGTKSLAASLTWPDQGNLVSLYLVDPSGRVRDAKGGDLWINDYARGLVPGSALTHTAEQVIWNAPDAGRWQVIVYAPGFSGNGFAEPFAGTITMDRTVVRPASWSASAAPGQTVTTNVSVANAGPTDLQVYADSQLVANGSALSRPIWAGDWTGTLSAKLNGDYQYVLVPQNATQLTAYAIWQNLDSTGSTLVDLELWDPVGTEVASSLAPTDQGNAVQVQNPIAGWWETNVAYGDPGNNPTAVGFDVWWMWTAPVPVGDITPAESAPNTVPAATTGTVPVSLTVPVDAQAGDTITGTVDLYTTDGESQLAGGDHLGSVPVTITVTAAP
jgi:hypothetical protein